MAILMLEPFPVQVVRPECLLTETLLRSSPQPPNRGPPLVETQTSSNKYRKEPAFAHGLSRGRGCEPCREGAAFINPLFHDLTMPIFSIDHHLARIDRLVQLTHARVNAKLTEHPLHPKGSSLVRHDRHNPLANIGVFHQNLKQTNKGHRG